MVTPSLPLLMTVLMLLLLLLVPERKVRWTVSGAPRLSVVHVQLMLVLTGTKPDGEHVTEGLLRTAGRHTHCHINVGIQDNRAGHVQLIFAHLDASVRTCFTICTSETWLYVIIHFFIGCYSEKAACRWCSLFWF
jgi:hypothetical protein